MTQPQTGWQTTKLELKAALRLVKHVPHFAPLSRWNLAKLVARNAEHWGARPALYFLDRIYTWAEVAEQTQRYAGFLRKRGVMPGDVVALLMDNRPEFIFIQTAITQLGAVAALLNTNLSGAPLAHAVRVSKPTLCIAGSEHASKMRDIAPELAQLTVMVQLEQPSHSSADFESINAAVASAPLFSTPAKTRVKAGMCFIYTSGTTGLPKAAVITHQRFLLAAHIFGRAVHEATPEDVIYVSLPLYHSNAQWAGWGAACVSGAAVALRRKFSASHFWQDAKHFGATRFVYIGELCRYLLNQPPRPEDRDHQLRIGVGNGLRPDIWEEFTQRFGVESMREFYGSTEGNAPMFNVEGRPGMIGRLWPSQIIVRCDLSTGKIYRDAQGRCEQLSSGTGLLLGHINPITRFDGYVDDSATSSKVERDVLRKGDAYFNSGDLLVLHPGRWVSFADRVGDTFRWKGENVSTNEVAEVLNKAPGVLESNVYGVLVPGMEGRAGMASLNITQEFELGRFAEFIIQELPSYQRPYFIRLQKEMRVTQTLKHQKVGYRDEGYDPARVNGDELYFLDGDRYIPIDEGVYARLANGELGPR